MYRVRMGITLMLVLLSSTFLSSCTIEGQFSYITPYYAYPGDENVVIKIGGEDTYFVQGLTFIYFDPSEGITVSNINIEGENTVVFEIDIADDAQTGDRTISVIYPGGYISWENVFEVWSKG